MKNCIIAIALLFVSTQSNAARIYEASASVDVAHFVEASDSAAVIDSIPQLGIVVVKERLDHSSFRDLGEVKQVKLIQPMNSVPKRLWGLQAIDIVSAWQVSQGEGVIVAVSDTGISLKHSDLAPNLWVNPGEVAENGIDDDNNGYIDDVHGWNFNKKKPANKDNHYHGTHVAGTIASRIGTKLAGVAPKAQLMSIAFLGGDGSGTEIDGAKTIVYAADNGAKIINCSWGGPGKSDVIEKAIAYAAAKGVLVVAAAGNDGMNTDRKPFFPAGANVDNVVSVGSTSDAKGKKSSFSNFGKTTVDIAAPGSNIFSASPTNGYQTLSGTSMASPHTAGVAALVWSANPLLTYQQVKAVLMQSAVPNKNWTGRSITGGVLNATHAVHAAVNN